MWRQPAPTGSVGASVSRGVLVADLVVASEAVVVVPVVVPVVEPVVVGPDVVVPVVDPAVVVPVVDPAVVMPVVDPAVVVVAAVVVVPSTDTQR